MCDGARLEVPDWYEPRRVRKGEIFGAAAELGRTVGATSSMAWRHLEPMLIRLWGELEVSPEWEEARFAIYHAWCLARHERGGRFPEQG